MPANALANGNMPMQVIFKLISLCRWQMAQFITLGSRIPTFEVTVTNLTNAQPLSPVAVIAHQSGYSTFTIGTAATAGLELMAEGGDNSMFLAEADADANVLTSASGAAPMAAVAGEVA